MPSISRRSFLVGGTALGGLVGGAFLPASYLPDSVAAWRARLRPVPELSTRPPVSSAHVAAARDDLASLVDRAEQVWARVNDQQAAVEALPGLADPARSLESARDSLDDAENASGWDALFDVRRGANFAGKALGGARLALDTASGEHLAEQAQEIQEAIASTAENVAYQVVEPSVGLARLYWVEKWLGLARLNSYRDGTYVGQDEPTTEYSDRDVVSTWGSHMQAHRFRADAARLYDEYRERADGSRRDVTEHVVHADADLYGEARRRTFDHDEFERRSERLESLPDGPYRTYRWFVMYYVQTADVRPPDGLWAGLPVYRAVENAETVLKARAFEDTLANASLSKNTDRVSGSLLARTKRNGLSMLREQLRAADDRPVLERLLREARRLLWAGDAELEDGSEVEYPRARAYAKYRLAVGYLGSVEDVASSIDRPASSG